MLWGSICATRSLLGFHSWVKGCGKTKNTGCQCKDATTDRKEFLMPPSVRPSPGAIFLSFLRLGATAFGGPAMIPYIREMAVTRKQWLSPSQFSLGMALAQAIPGATAMQAAAYTGLRAGGVGGALAAYIGFGLPAFGLIAVLSALYATFRDTSFILAAMSGLQVIVVALVGNASIDFANRHLDTRLDKILALAAGCVFGLKGSPVLAIAGVCLAGVLLYSDEPYEPAPVIAGNVSWKPVAALGVLLGVCLIVMRFLAPGLFQLGATMLKVDLFAFGGGYVALPIMLHEVVDVHAWMSRPVFMDGIALGQVTPGPIVMTAGFVGYLVMGFSGAAWATICVFAPSFFMVCGLTPVAERLLSNAFFRRAVRASLASLVGLMAAVTGTFMLSAHWQPASIGLAVGAFVALRRGVDILWVVIAGAAVAMLVL